MFPRYHCIQSGLTQQKAELQDTRSLTESLERVELEESQERCREERLVQVSSQTWQTSPAGSRSETPERADSSCLPSDRQPLQRETSSAEVGVWSSGDQPLAESLGNPAENLQEAAESLSHTQKSHFHKHEEAVEELLSKVWRRKGSSTLIGDFPKCLLVCLGFFFFLE